MKNYLQPGNSITVPAPAGGAVSGKPAAMGSLRGFYASSAPEGAPVAVNRTGVFEVVKAAGEAWGIGDKLHYSATNQNFTKAAADAVVFGFAGAPADAAAITGEIVLGDTV